MTLRPEDILRKLRQAESRVIIARGELRDAEARVSGLRRTLTAALAHEDPLRFRQSQVLVLVKEGNTNKEIASALAISLRTVKFHIEGLLRHFGVSNRTNLAVVADGVKLHPGAEQPKVLRMRDAG